MKARIARIGLGVVLGLAWVVAMFALYLVFAGPVDAQQPGLQCNTLDEVVRHLKERYNEEVVATGTTHNGGTMTIFASPGGATYSVTITAPALAMPTCLIAAGENWRATAAKPAGDKI